MSEGLVSEDLASASKLTEATRDAAVLLSAGQMLRQARVNAGVHVAALAVTLKVPVKRLEALEDDNMALLPDTVFVRALASSVCRTLKVDSGLILERLPKVASPLLNSSEGAINRSINRPIRMATPAGRFHFFELLKAPWAMGVLLLLVGAACIYIWPKPLSRAGFDVPATAPLLPVSVDLGVLKDASASKKTSSGAIHSVNDVAGVTTAVHIKEQNPAMENRNMANFEVTAPRDFSLIALNTTPPPNSIVVFKATGQTWVEVKTVNGITILKKLLNDGEVAGATGTLPLTVIVGRADVTQVEVRGRQVDLSTIAKSNVARFEVN